MTTKITKVNSAKPASACGSAWVEDRLEARHREVADATAIDIPALHDSLRRLAQMDERKSRIVELNLFGGMTYEETANTVGISPATVNRELRFAKAWLLDDLRRTGP